MAIEFDVQAGNRTVKITVGVSGAASPGNNPARNKQGGDGPAESSSDTGSGAPASGCCGPLVIGPIVVDGKGLRGQSTQGGDGPAESSSDTGSGGPKLGGDGPAESSSDTGSGGPASSGCCGPIVIGPIVISDCCGSTAGPSGCAKQVVVNPPAHARVP